MLAPLLAVGLDDDHMASAAEGGIGGNMVSLSRSLRGDNVENSYAFGRQSCWRPRGKPRGARRRRRWKFLGPTPRTSSQILDLPTRTPAVFHAGNEVGRPMSGPIPSLHSGGLPLVGYGPNYSCGFRGCPFVGCTLSSMSNVVSISST